MKLLNLFAAAALAVISGISASPSKAAIIDLGFSLDGSGSVNFTNFSSARNALANALANIPTSGGNQYRLAVTTFSSGVTTVVPPTIVTAANIGSIQDNVRNANYAGSTTNTAAAITQTFNLFANSAGGLGQTTLLNITTDGSPNSQSAAESAALAANGAGLDGLGFEAVDGFNTTTLENMRQIAGLGTTGDTNGAILVNDVDDLPNVTQQGFVLSLSDFDAYAGAIGAKVQRVVDDTDPTNPSVVPLPAGLPLLMSGFLTLFGIRRWRAA